MKLLPLVLFLSFGVVADLSAQGTSAQSILSDAQAAYIRGDIAEAKKGFQMVLRIDPRNLVAINYMKMISVAESKAPKGNDQEKKLEQVIVPKVEFREATLSSALDYLRQSVSKTTNGATNLSFVVQLPEEQANTQVTVSLSNIPVTEVLKYLGSLANVRFEYDKYAIRVVPAGGATAATASAPAK